jgi:glucan phosphorylase
MCRNYGVSRVAEMIMPGADLSEQISTAPATEAFGHRQHEACT